MKRLWPINLLNSCLINPYSFISSGDYGWAIELDPQHLQEPMVYTYRLHLLSPTTVHFLLPAPTLWLVPAALQRIFSNSVLARLPLICLHWERRSSGGTKSLIHSPAGLSRAAAKSTTESTLFFLFQSTNRHTILGQSIHQCIHSLHSFSPRRRCPWARAYPNTHQTGGRVQHGQFSN